MQENTTAVPVSCMGAVETAECPEAAELSLGMPQRKLHLSQPVAECHLQTNTINIQGRYVPAFLLKKCGNIVTINNKI